MVWRARRGVKPGRANALYQLTLMEAALNTPVTPVKTQGNHVLTLRVFFGPAWLGKEPPFRSTPESRRPFDPVIVQLPSVLDSGLRRNDDEHAFALLNPRASLTRPVACTRIGMILSLKKRASQRPMFPYALFRARRTYYRKRGLLNDAGSSGQQANSPSIRHAGGGLLRWVG